MKLHPLSAVIRAVKYGGNGVAVPLFAGVVLTGIDAIQSVWLFVLVPLGALVGAGYGVLTYLRFEYELTDDTLDVGAGVMRRREREIPLRRVQNVDVSRDVIQRVLGVAVVRVETAGGGSTEATLSVVSVDEADRLRRGIRERRRRLLEAEDEDEADIGPGATTDEVPGRGPTTDVVPGPGSTADETSGPPVGDEPGPTTATTGVPDGADLSRTEPLFAISPLELLVLSLTRFRPRSLLFLIFAIPLADDLAVDLLLAVAGPLGGPATLDPAALTVDDLFVLGLVGVPMAAVGGLLLGAVVSVLEYHDFRLGRAGDDLVYERGLLQRYSGSVPTDKIQTVTVTESWLARPFGYAGLAVETAGYAGDRAEQGSLSAVPLSRREHVADLARDLVDFESPALQRPPRLARRRYAVRYGLVVAALVGVAYGVALLRPDFSLWYLPAALFALVPVAAHVKWANRGYHLGEDHVVLRTGFWTRRTEVVPYYRLQTVIRERSIFQRRLGLAHLVADTASSASLVRDAPTAYDIDADTAVALVTALRDRLQADLGQGTSRGQ